MDSGILLVFVFATATSSQLKMTRDHDHPADYFMWLTGVITGTKENMGTPHTTHLFAGMGSCEARCP